MKTIQFSDTRLITRPLSKRLDVFYSKNALAEHYVINGHYGGTFRKSLADWIKRLRQYKPEFKMGYKI